ncbi:hypothetical protein KM043_006013 [Ampulex compressa]|nr:hypothetical protein KM043_006013 [Ampulex compressa]
MFIQRRPSTAIRTPAWFPRDTIRKTRGLASFNVVGQPDDDRFLEESKRFELKTWADDSGQKRRADEREEKGVKFLERGFSVVSTVTPSHLQDPKELERNFLLAKIPAQNSPRIQNCPRIREVYSPLVSRVLVCQDREITRARKNSPVILTVESPSRKSYESRRAERSASREREASRRAAGSVLESLKKEKAAERRRRRRGADGSVTSSQRGRPTKRRDGEGATYLGGRRGRRERDVGRSKESEREGESTGGTSPAELVLEMGKGSLSSTERRSSDDFDEESMVKRTRWRNLIAFWILGLCNNYGYVVMLSAAHDILDDKSASNESYENSTVNGTDIRACNTVSTGAILLADILPSLVIKITVPFLPFLIHARLATCVLFSAAGFLLVSLSTIEWLTILGVVITSISSGLGEVTLLSYSHQYPKQVISTWSSGTGGAGIIGAASYAGLTTFLNTRDTLLIMLIVPILQGITFWFILVHPARSSVPITKNGIDSQEQIIETPKKGFKDKINLVPGLLKYMIPLGLVYLFEYFINHGLYELIEFNGIWLSHPEQYRWLQVDYQIGVFISRSSVNLITINKIWIMAVLQFVNVIIMLFESIYYYIPNIWIVFAIVLWEGLLGGGAYVNTFYRMSTEIPRSDLKISLGIATMADSIGITLAGWLSMPVHNAICRLPKPSRLGS